MADVEPIFLPLIEPPADHGADRRYIHVAANGVWIGDAPADPTWPTHFLGRLGAAAVWGVDVPVEHDASLPAVTDLYTYFGESTESEWLAAGRAVQIVEWARTHRFCGRCAAPTEPSPGERALRCPRCGLSNYPRLAPAMIVLVTRGEGRAREALLAQGVRMRAVMYSCLAGFVEPGESLEGAVQREVREEVSIEVGNIRYWGSQPWPFPHSLMVGFHAEWASGEIVCDPSEIVDAQWFRRDALPPRPHRRSIASALIDDWLTHPDW